MQVKCTSCGASQNISENQNCEFCKNLIELESAKNNYQSFLNSESSNLMIMAETAIDATNWDEALQFYNQVLIKDITNSDAWLGKGIAVVYTSKIGDLKITEAIAYWKNAIKHSSNTNAMAKRVAKEIDSVVKQFYPNIENHYIQFHDLEDSYIELVNRFVILENAQNYATQIDSENENLYLTGFNLCKRVIKIPEQYANQNQSSAIAGAILGQFNSNSYSRKSAINDASKAYSNAHNRKKEIARASEIIFELEEKYKNGILRINPNAEITSSKMNFKDSTKFKEDEILANEGRIAVLKYKWNNLSKTKQRILIFIAVIYLYTFLRALFLNL